MNWYFRRNFYEIGLEMIGNCWKDFASKGQNGNSIDIGEWCSMSQFCEITCGCSRPAFSRVLLNVSGEYLPSKAWPFVPSHLSCTDVKFKVLSSDDKETLLQLDQRL
jgi:hypothetical protein